MSIKIVDKEDLEPLGTLVLGSLFLLDGNLYIISRIECSIIYTNLDIVVYNLENGELKTLSPYKKVQPVKIVNVEVIKI